MNILSLGAAVNVKAPFDAPSGASLGRAQYELRVGAFVNRELEVVSFEGTEKLSAPYVYDVVFASSVPTEVLQAGVFGFPACLSIQVPKKEPRVIQGLAVGFEAIGAAESELETKTRRYMARVVPRLWLLNHNRKYRVFQDQSAVDIACAVLEDAGITPDVRLERSDYPPIPFMYQRGETDLEFLHHVLAVAGIFYYFQHASGFLDRLMPGAGEVGAYAGALGGGFGAVASAAGATTALVLCDRARHTSALQDTALSAGGGFGVAAATGDSLGALGGALGSVANTVGAAASVVGGALAEALPYDGNGQAAAAMERVFAFRARSEVRPKRVALGDWSVADCASVRMEEQSAAATLDVSAGVSVFGIDSGGASLSARTTADLDVDALPIATKDASVTEYQWDAALLGARDPFAEKALGQLRSDRITARGESDCRRLAPGYRFKLARHPIGPINTEYVVTTVCCSGYAPDHLPESYPLYRNVFECVPATVDPRPAKPAPRPPLGLEAAVVVGPVYGDVNCDAIGRIQVRFRWAPYSATYAPDAEGTCWVHWLERWAGNGFGTMTLPRVGSEVLVDFLQAEGGRPVAVGQLYSRVNGPPFDLPREGTKVGIRSHSVRDEGGFSEISIDDRPGGTLLIRALEDQETHVLVDQRLHVRRNQTTHVDGSVHQRTNGASTMEIAGDVTTAFGGSHVSSVGGDLVAALAGNAKVAIEGATDLNLTRSLSARVGSSSSFAVAGSAVVAIDQCLDTTIGGSESHTVVGRQVTTVGGGAASGPSGSDTAVFGTYAVSASDTISFESQTAISLRCGNAELRLTPQTISLLADVVNGSAAKQLELSGAGPSLVLSDTLDVTAKTLTLQSSGAQLSLGDNAKLTGRKVSLGSGSGNSPLSSNSSSSSPKTLSLCVVDSTGAALGNAHYQLSASGKTIEGTTDSSGNLHVALDPDVKTARMTVWTGDFPEGPRITYTIDLLPLKDPQTVEGAQQRLQNLGYYAGPVTGKMNLATRDGLLVFQIHNGVEPTGLLDSTTIAALTDQHP